MEIWFLSIRVLELQTLDLGGEAGVLVGLGF